MIARWAIAPPHHPLNHYAVTDGALRRFPVDVLGKARRAAPDSHFLLRAQWWRPDQKLGPAKAP